MRMNREQWAAVFEANRDKANHEICELVGITSGTVSTARRLWRAENANRPDTTTTEAPSETEAAPAPAPAPAAVSKLEVAVNDLVDAIVALVMETAEDKIETRIAEVISGVAMRTIVGKVDTQAEVATAFVPAAKKRKVCIVGLYAQQQVMIDREYCDSLRVTFISADKWTPSGVAAQCKGQDRVILMTNFISHQLGDTVKAGAGDVPVELLAGGMSTLRARLDEGV